MRLCNVLLLTFLYFQSIDQCFAERKQLKSPSDSLVATDKNNAPHISGDVYISVKLGTIKADLTVSRLPRISNYSIGLNTGFNVQDFRDSTGKMVYTFEREYDKDKSKESFQYWIPGRDSNQRHLPESFKITYMGLFPVHTDSARRSDYEDWKGNIAFNGKTLRAAEQTAWYPTLYDISQDKLYQNVTFDITVHASDSKALYINGCAPQYGQKARFQSEKAFPLLIFAGDFDFKKQKNSYMLNTSFTTSQAKILDSTLTRVRSFYEKSLQIPYGTNIVLLAGTPISKRNDWLFVTFPTIASISANNFLGTLVNEKTRSLSQPDYLSFMAHELGHYYFGSIISPNSTMRWFFLEGCAEYLSLQAIRALLGDDQYKLRLKSYISASSNIQNFVPLKYITESNQINEVYRYKYVPLLLTKLERDVGTEQMWKWLNNVLHSKSPTTDYEFLKHSMLNSGIDEKKYLTFEQQFLLSKDSLKNLLSQF